MWKYLLLLRERSLAQRPTCCSLTSRETSESITIDTVSLTFPRSCLAAPSLGKNHSSRSARASFAQRNFNFLHNNSSKNIIQLDLICSKMHPQPRWSCASNTYCSMLQKAHEIYIKHTKMVKTTQTHKNKTKHNININTHKVGDFMTKHDKNNGKGPRNRC